MGFFAKLLGLEPKPMPVSIDDASFEREVRVSKVPVIVDVWGPNCRPCKQLEPIMMQLAADYAGRVKVCEMSTLAGPQTASKLRVRGTPTVLYFHHGKEVERVTGLRSSLYHEEVIAELFGIPKKPAKNAEAE